MLETRDPSNKKTKRSKGKTGVELRYYKYGEFKKLTQEQKDQLTKLWAEKKKQDGPKDTDNSNEGLSNKKKRARFKDSVVSSVVQQLKDDQGKQSSTIGAKSSILKSSSSATSSSTHTVGSAESRGSTTNQRVASPDGSSGSCN